VEDSYDNPVVKSKQVVAAGSTGAIAGIVAPPSTLAPLQTGGVAGTRANLPPSPNTGGTPAPAATTTLAVTPSPASTTNTTEVTNYEVGHKNVHRIAPAGEIVKMSVAVLIDGDRPASADGSTPAKSVDIQKIQELVKSAVGFDAERGDQMAIENIPFEEAPAEEMVTPGVWQKYGPQAFEAVRILGIVAIGVLALFTIVRPMVRGALAAVPAAPQMAMTRRAAVAAVVANAGPGPRTVQDIEAEMDAQLEATDAQRLPVLTKRMAAMTQREPENAAKLLRTWLSEER
jgi:flagellar M-ring protein FliF